MSKAEITRQLAQFVEKTGISDIPDPVVQKAKELITDFLGVTTAGAVEPPSQIIQGFIREQEAVGNSTIIGTSLRSQSNWAALANGIAGHALDFDDTSQPLYGHPTVPVLPAALAVGESQGATGPALLESYIIGLEVTVKLAYGMNPAHYKHGWHSTCTLGSIGSAVAVAKLLGLKEEKIRNTLALAASQAGGLQQNFGTMTKPFHAGRAAENGVLAAILAQKGWTGDQNIMESPLGFFHIFCGPGQYDAEKVVSQLGKPYDIEKPGVIVKKFPSCAFSHPAVDAALMISEDPQYKPGEVEKVEGEIHGLADQILIHRNPRTGLEAKFSLEACIALALLDGRVSTRSFTDEKVRSRGVREMIERVERKVVSMDGETPRDFGPARVKVFLKGGGVLEAMVDKAKGSPDNPMSIEEIQNKYADCCSGVLPKDSVEKSLSLLQELDQLEKIEELMACFRVS